MPTRRLATLLTQIRACRVCEAHLPLGPNPVVRAGVGASGGDLRRPPTVSPTERVELLSRGPELRIGEGQRSIALPPLTRPQVNRLSEHRGRKCNVILQ